VAATSTDRQREYPMSFDTKALNEAVNCTRCKQPLLSVTKSGQRMGVFDSETGALKEAVCPRCEVQERITEYEQKGGELTIRLVTDAQSAVMWIDQFKEPHRLQPVYATVYQQNIGFYRRVFADYQEVETAARLAEIAVWFGRPDRADLATVEASNKFAQRLPTDKGQDFGLKPGPKAVQTYCKRTTKRGHSYTHSDFKVLLWGSAGRVLLTIQDGRLQSDPKARFGGANLTLIFDEDSTHPRGGIQSMAGTKQECLNLIQALRECDLVFVPDPAVGIF
jgi:hypothetical protein